jgi:hypothetical protein
VDGRASDGEVNIEDNLPYGTAFTVNEAMVNIIIDLKNLKNFD